MKNNFYISFFIGLVIWIWLCLLYNYCYDLMVMKNIDDDYNQIILELMKLKELQAQTQSNIYEIKQSLQDWQIISN